MFIIHEIDLERLHQKRRLKDRYLNHDNMLAPTGKAHTRPNKSVQLNVFVERTTPGIIGVVISKSKYKDHGLGIDTISPSITMNSLNLWEKQPKMPSVLLFGTHHTSDKSGLANT